MEIIKLILRDVASAEIDTNVPTKYWIEDVGSNSATVRELWSSKIDHSDRFTLFRAIDHDDPFAFRDLIENIILHDPNYSEIVIYGCVFSDEFLEINRTLGILKVPGDSQYRIVRSQQKQN